jgi:hypothetical protein
MYNDNQLSPAHQRALAASLEMKRQGEHMNIIQAPGEGCAVCIDGAKSDSIASQIDMCRQTLGYLPIHMSVTDQRPAWCPGFERNGNGVAAETMDKGINEQNETTQEELPL